jgi:TonB family protein
MLARFVCAFVLLLNTAALADGQSQPPPPVQQEDSSCGPIVKILGLEPPRATYTPDPKYTKEARKRRIEGVVVLRVVVCPDGKARDITVAKPLGYGLDDEAVRAVLDWRFKPARNGKESIPVKVYIEVSFRL